MSLLLKVNMLFYICFFCSQWQTRLSTFESIVNETIVKSSTKSFEDFDRCMGAINSEHWTMSVSRCLTPHVCYSRLAR